MTCEVHPARWDLHTTFAIYWQKTLNRNNMSSIETGHFFRNIDVLFSRFRLRDVLEAELGLVGHTTRCLGRGAILLKHLPILTKLWTNLKTCLKSTVA